jgi:urease subunit gamma/beta
MPGERGDPRPSPGEILLARDPIVLNAGRATVEVEVENTSDHTIFVSSHFPFFEVNRRLVFDRTRAWGMHLDLPAGDAERWRPAESKRVRLVAFGGRGIVRGFNGLSEGPATPERLAEAVARAEQRGYGHRPACQGDHGQ